MNRSDLFQTSLYAITSQKLRTLLSMLGVIIGVVTIILVVAIGSGAQQQVQEQFKSMSVDTIMIFPMRGFTLSIDDVTLLKQSSHVKNAVGFYQSTNTISTEDGTSSNISVLGITPDMFDIVSMKLAAGSMLSQDDEGSKSVILGYGAFTQLFPNSSTSDVLGSLITINKKDYIINGVFQKAGGGFGPLSFDDSVYIPLTTFEKNIAKGGKSNTQLRITATAKSTDQVAQAVEDLTNIINETYELSSTDNKFRVIDAGSTVATAQANAKTLKYLLMGIASIVFLVSGIGIMNVMFASVAERTKEIGILKSIGADQQSILWQFLLESLLLTIVGSCIGVVRGEGIIFRDPLNEILPLTRTVSGDLVAVGFAMATGLFFGWYPARKASQLDPVDALRS